MDEITALLTIQQQQQQVSLPAEEQQWAFRFLTVGLLRWCMAGGSAVLSLPEQVRGITMRQRAVNLAAVLTHNLQRPHGTLHLETVLQVMDRCGELEWGVCCREQRVGVWSLPAQGYVVLHSAPPA